MAKKLFKFISYDIKNGLLRKWTVYAAAVLACLISTNMADASLADNAAGTDYMFAAFSGMVRFYISPTAMFSIPIVWFVFMIIPSFLVGYYAVDDLNAYGIQLIVKSRSKMSWWISKTVWCVLAVAVYFVVMFLTFAAYAYCTGRKVIGDADNWCMWAGSYSQSGMGQLLAHGILMPFITVTALCMAQMFLSLLFGAMAAYVAVIMYDIVSAYATSPVFIGNYAMLLRDKAYMYDGLDFKYGLIINLSIIVITFIAGAVTIKKTALFKYSGRVV